MLQAIQKADTLIEAMGWIRRFRDKITVIKLGGSVMEDENALRLLGAFTICVGVSRSDTSKNILRHVTESRDLLYMFHDRLLKSVPKHYDKTFNPSVLDAWLFALQTMVLLK